MMTWWPMNDSIPRPVMTIVEVIWWPFPRWSHQYYSDLIILDILMTCGVFGNLSSIDWFIELTGDIPYSGPAQWWQCSIPMTRWWWPVTTVVMLWSMIFSDDDGRPLMTSTTMMMIFGDDRWCWRYSDQSQAMTGDDWPIHSVLLMSPIHWLRKWWWWWPIQVVLETLMTQWWLKRK